MTTNPTSWNRVSGDIKDTITVYLYGVATFAGCTAQTRVRPARGGAVQNLTAAVVNGLDADLEACGILTVQLGDVGGWLPTAAVGTWLADHKITFPDGSLVTWAEDDPNEIHVRA